MVVPEELCFMQCLGCLIGRCKMTLRPSEDV